MTHFHGFDASQAIVDFLIDSAGTCLSEPSRNHVRDAVAGSDGLRAIVVTMETLYAERADCPAGHDLCHDLAQFVSQHNFYGLGGLEGRATKIAQVMQRIAEGGPAVEEDDLERNPAYAPVAATPETPADPVVP